MKIIKFSIINWENINKAQLVKQIGLTYSKEFLKNEKLSDVVPQPNTRTTLNSFIFQRGTVRKTDEDSQFVPANRFPNSDETVKLIGLLVADTVKVCMLNHYYTIGGDIQRKSEGGSI